MEVRRIHHPPDLPKELFLHDDGEPLVLVILGHAQLALRRPLLGAGTVASLEANLLTGPGTNHDAENAVRLKSMRFDF